MQLLLIPKVFKPSDVIQMKPPVFKPMPDMKPISKPPPDASKSNIPILKKDWNYKTKPIN